jgi:hypothetical protein
VTDIIVILREQATTQQLATNATQTWVPTMPVGISGGLLIPAPKTIAVPSTGSVTVTNVQPCDGSEGWCWLVTTTEDGVIRDQRYVLVPDIPLQDFEALMQVRLSDLHNLNADQVWVGLDDDPPPALFRGWWLDSAPGNPALGTDTGSGDLRRVL